ncbi:MAG: nucleotide exchange factor GrpE [Patescibacteria group bacterium]
MPDIKKTVPAERGGGEQKKDTGMAPEIMQRKMEEYLNGWKRAKADYINFKRESEKKQQETVQYATAAVILELLPIYDNFKLAWKHIPEGKQQDDWLKGIGHIKQQFKELLKSLGIEEIKTVGERFNPELHDAVAKEKADGTESGTVIEELKGGYKLYDRVLEHAKVKVAE